MSSEPIRILIKYCGGCNPTIDRVNIVKLLLAKLEGTIKVVSGESDVTDVVLFVCGCPTSCIIKSGFTGTGNMIIVSGAGVDYMPMDEVKIPDFLAQKIKNLKVTSKIDG